MATIIEGALWTLTEYAAESMVEKGILVRCGANHRDVLEVDKPIYHLSIDAPDDVGQSNLHVHIIEAEKEFHPSSLP